MNKKLCFLVTILLCLILSITAFAEETNAAVQDALILDRETETAEIEEQCLQLGSVYEVITQKNVILRVAPQWNAAGFVRLANRSLVKVLEDCGTYAKVHTEDGQTGYMLAGYLRIAPGRSLEDIPLHDAVSVIGTERVALRQSPDAGSLCIEKLAPGTVLTFLRLQGAYAYVQWENGRTGFVPTEKLSNGVAVQWDETDTLIGQTGGTWYIPTADWEAFRRTPDMNGEIMGWIRTGEEMTLLGYYERFAMVEYRGKTGYVYACNIAPKKSFTELKVVKPTEKYTYAQMRQDAKALAERYGNISVGSIGLTALGREIPLLTIGDPDAPKKVLVQASIHAREYMTSLVTMCMVEYMLACPGDPFAQGTVGDAIRDTCFYVVPMANPDGIIISQEQVMTHRLSLIYQSDRNYGRAGYDWHGYLYRWKANANGVDLNRNFDAQWAGLYDQRGVPSSDGYKGARAADQPESKALVSFTQSHDIDVTLSLHASGSLIYWQYGTREDVNELSRDLGRSVQEVSGYPITQQSALSVAGFKDWAMEAMGIPSLTIEMGCRSAPLAMDEFYSTYQRSRLILPAIARWIQ